MNWNKEEMLESIRNYFRNVSQEQFEHDLIETNSAHLVEDFLPLKETKQ